MDKEKLRQHFDEIADRRDYWINKNPYYYRTLKDIYTSLIPEGSSVLEIGCGAGQLLAAVCPKRGVGIDLSPKMVEIASRKFPDLEFGVGDVENLSLDEKFDYIILSDVVGLLSDIWQAFQELRKVCHSETKIIINIFNFLWYPVLMMGEKLQMKMPNMQDNWVSLEDIKNLLYLAGYETLQTGYELLLPKRILPLTGAINEVGSRTFLKRLGLLHYLVATPSKEITESKELACSIIIPCRNEAGNIEGCVERIPELGRHTELIFVDGDSNDGTVEKIEEFIGKYKGKKDIKLIHQQPAIGKGDAVRKGFEAATGDVLMILDADLTVPPEDLPKFYYPVAQSRADFVNGTRLVYPMEKEAMRTLNYFGNKFFSLVFTWLLGQRIRDTLCGTKVLLKEDYENIKRNRGYFGDFDPFGDFDLLFGASKQNLRIVEMPIRYRQRVYGDIKIQRFKHGLLLFRMAFIGFRKFKLNKWFGRGNRDASHN